MEKHEPFGEALRRSAAKGRRPPHVILAVRCRAQLHPVLWVSAYEGDLVPVVRVGRAELRYEAFVDGEGVTRPRILSDWADDDRLPIGECACGYFSGPTGRQVRQWLASGLRKILVDPV